MVTCRDFIVEPGESVLVATWLCRISLGADMGGGVIDADYRGEVKVILTTAAMKR